ncbi:vitronectin-like [Amblyraja radiata]|uniref:vitronectin-like n=1 Tax=Amblyraja radiata TaxID=386614 RepID=UPI0014022989|nr:vitronectin-like [Amblyraja radiata]
MDGARWENVRVSTTEGGGAQQQRDDSVQIDLKVLEYETEKIAGANGPFSIRRRWGGIPSGVDAVMIGKLQMVPKQKQKGRGRGRGRGEHHKNRRPKDRHRKDSSSEEDDSNNFRPHHSIYFFVRDKYYLVDLTSKRVDIAGPRSITKYWFKCEVE